MSGEGSRPPGSFLRMFRESSSGAPGNSEVAKSQGTSSLETRRLRNRQVLALVPVLALLLALLELLELLVLLVLVLTLVLALVLVPALVL